MIVFSHHFSRIMSNAEAAQTHKAAPKLSAEKQRDKKKKKDEAKVEVEVEVEKQNVEAEKDGKKKRRNNKSSNKTTGKQSDHQLKPLSPVKYFLSPDDNALIAYRHYPSKNAKSSPTLVLLNGLACSMDMWGSLFVQLLSEHVDLLMVDHRGVGDSRRKLSRDNIDENSRLTIQDITTTKMAEDVNHLLQSRGITSVVLCGFSFGFCVCQ